MKVWYLLSVCFFLANFRILKHDSTEVHFCKTDEVDFDQLSYSFCLTIEELVEDGTFNYSDVLLPSEMIDKVTQIYLNYQRDSLSLNLSYIFHHSVCFEIVDLKKFRQIFRGIRKFRFKLFLRFTPNSLLYFFEDIYTHNPIMDKSFDLKIGFIKVHFLEAPYRPECTKFKIYNGRREKFSKLNCLLRCYKSTRNHTIFHYKYQENIPLNLCAYRFHSTDECEEFCRERYDCNAFLMFVYLSYKEGTKKLDDPEIDTRGFVFKAFPIIREWNFHIQFASLMTLLFNTSFNQMLISGTNLLRDLLKRVGNSKTKNLAIKYLPKVHPMITVLCFLLLAIVSAFSIRRYFRFEYVTKSYTLPTDARYEFTLIICMPVQLAYSSSDLAKADISVENELLFDNETFLQIEHKTNDLLDRSIRDVHLRRGGLIYPFDERRIINQTIFKTQTYITYTKRAIDQNESQFDLFSRCFRIDLDVKEPKFIRASALTEIIFNLTHPHFTTFYLDFQKRLTSYHNSTKLLSKLYLQKLVFLEAPYASDCLVYPEVYKCDSRSACIDLSYNKQYIVNQSTIPKNSVIYREDFEAFNLSKVRFSSKEDLHLRRSIERAYPNIDCEKKFFTEELEQDQILNDDRNRIMVDVYYFKEIRYEDEELTLASLLLLIFNYETLFVGLSFRGTADWILGLLRSNRCIGTKWQGITKLILNFICIGSFLLFTFNVINESVFDELTRSTYFEKVKQIYLPAFAICFPIDLENIDPNRKMTREYMDELSSHLTLTKIFDKATYFDQDLYERNLSFSDANAVNSFFKHKPYYAFAMKCFDFFAANVTFSEHQLFYFSELFSLKIYLKPEIYLGGCGDCLKIYISFFEEGLGDFERLAPYYLRRKKKTKVSLRIRPNLIEVVYNDKFFFVRKPFSLFNFREERNPDMVYLSRLKANFARLTNCTTNMLYVASDHGLEFCDDLLEQYFEQVQKHIDRSLYINPNFVSVIYNINPIATFEPNAWPELVFVPPQIRIRQIITSKVNVAELIINILNGLSFCLGKSILDIHIDIHKPLLVLTRTMCSLLLKLKNFLNPNKFIG